MNSNPITKQEITTSCAFALVAVGIPIFGIITLYAGSSFLTSALMYGITIAMSLILLQVILPRRIKLRWIARVIVLLGAITLPSFVIAIQTTLFADDLASDIRPTFSELTEIRVTSISSDRATVFGIGSCCCKIGTNLKKNGRAKYKLELRKENQDWKLNSWDVEWSECGNAGSFK